MDHLLTIPEELFLLTVNESTGRRAFLKSRKFDVLLSAAILMDLSLHGRIDSDLESIIPVRPDPTGHVLLDEALVQIIRQREIQKISWWLLKLAEQSRRYREMLVKGLLQKGLVRMEKEHVFLGFKSHTYPIPASDKEIPVIKSRIRKLVFSEDLPDFRDVVIISVAWYGGLMDLVFSPEEIQQRGERMEQLARMDLIGQAVSSSMQKITQSIIGMIQTGEIFGPRTPEEKLDELVEELKALMHIDKDEDMPEWLCRGTAQYQKTLEFIRKTGTNEIVFNTQSGEYGLKAGANQGRTF